MVSPVEGEAEEENVKKESRPSLYITNSKYIKMRNGFSPFGFWWLFFALQGPIQFKIPMKNSLLPLSLD